METMKYKLIRDVIWVKAWKEVCFKMDADLCWGLHVNDKWLYEIYVDWELNTNLSKLTDVLWISPLFFEKDIGKPKPLDNIDLTELKKICQEYIDFVDSDGYHEDGDHMHYISEEAMTTIYWEDVWTYINDNI